MPPSLPLTLHEFLPSTFRRIVAQSCRDVTLTLHLVLLSVVQPQSPCLRIEGDFAVLTLVDNHHVVSIATPAVIHRRRGRRGL